MKKIFVKPQPRFYASRQPGHPQLISCILGCMCLLLAACGPSQAALNAQATVLAARNNATLVASQPTSTPMPTFTATATSTTPPTLTPTLTPTQTATPTLTPIPGAVVIASALIVRDGPGRQYSPLGQYTQKEQLDIIGQFENCSWLKTLSRKQSLTGWVSNTRQSIQYPLRCQDIPLGTYRPITGVIRPNQDAGGYGLLTITNGAGDDCVAVLTRNGKLVTALYLRAMENYSVNNIKDATYNLYFSKGSEWNGKEFLSSPTYQQFADPLVFSTTNTAQGIKYSTWNVTLQAAANGNEPVNNVAANDFPDIGN
ncbi:MAG: SH3 domain-containing protein [Anaerolineaceae bacterium]|nr:SH3 domain-containing protein [Anaerolineaceae bacterium]